jgi:hypothetical protein
MKTIYVALSTLTLFLATTIALSAHNFKKGKLEGCEIMLRQLALDTQYQVHCMYDDYNKLNLNILHIETNTTEFHNLE